MKENRVSPLYPNLDKIIASIGEAGQRLVEIGASEGAAGNISVFVGWYIDPRTQFPVKEEISLPVSMPELTKGIFLVTGSGRRLREIAADPEANIGVAVIDSAGTTAQLYTSHRRLFSDLTSEFNSHLAIHRQQIQAHDLKFHALIHAQPVHVTYLTHVPAYQDSRYFNQHILRWQPELIMNLPEGVPLVPFLPPGSLPLMQATLKAMQSHQVVIWSKHGIIARSNVSVKRACDLIEYVDAGAQYEYMNLVNGERAEGLSMAEINEICKTMDIQQDIWN